MATSQTPLLLLIDGLLSPHAARVIDAVYIMVDMLQEKQVRWVFNLPSRLEGASPPDMAYLYLLLKAFLSVFPEETATPSSHDGSFPLHFAASFGDVYMARLIYEKFPAAASAPNQKGKIPLHYAAREGRLDMVHFLIQQQPHTASIPSHKAKLALHFAAGDGHYAIVQTLLDVYPQGATLPSKKGKLPLHFAARWSHLRIAQSLIQVFPDGVWTCDWEGSLPLHDAARQGQYLMSRYLVEQYPAGLAAENIRGEIPLFPALRSHNLDMVVFMIQAWPSGGKHVLSRVSTNDSVVDWSWETLELLLRGAVHRLEGCPLLEGREPPSVCLDTDTVHNMMLNKQRSTSPILGARKKRIYGQELMDRKRPKSDTQSVSSLMLSTSSYSSSQFPFYPLHAALACQASTPVLSRVLETLQDCDDFNKVDDLGRYPLHWAIASAFQNNKTPDLEQPTKVDLIVSHILPHSPLPVLLSRDALNCRLPLHIAICSRADAQIVTALLDACPETGILPCKTKDEWHSVKPVFMACHFDCDLTSVYKLLRLDPSVIQKK